MNKLSYKKDKKVLTFEGEEKDFHTIGSKLFPLSKKKNIGLWWNGNTKEIERNKSLVMLLNSVSNHKFGAGKCYKNAEIVRMVGEKAGLNIKYYSGWLFAFQKLPVHHAWNVINDRFIIDTSIDGLYLKTQERMFEFLGTVEGDLTKEEYRTKYVDFVEQLTKEHKEPIGTDCLYGKVPNGLVYFGTEDTYNDSIDLFHKCLDENKNHPSYKHKRDERGESETQILMRERGLF